MVNARLTCHAYEFPVHINVEYDANAEYENPLKNSEKNSMCCRKVNVSNNGEKK